MSLKLMRLKNLKNKKRHSLSRIHVNTAFSLLEVLLASVIFVVSVAGLFATLNAVRGPVINKENQLAAVVFGKQVSDALYSQVTDSASYYGICATTPCQNFDLEVGVHQVSPATLQATAGLSWPTSLTTCNANLNYTVYCADNNSTTPPCSSINVAHMVSLNIKWWNFITGACVT